MAHFGIISPPVHGHIDPCSALGRELQARGHRVTYFQVIDLEKKVRGEGLEFHAIGESDHPRGSLSRSLAELGQLQGVSALRFTIRAVARTTEMTCRDLPAAVKGDGVDALLVDQMEPAGGAVAEHLGLPFFTVCNALALNRDSSVPPPFSPWRYTCTPWARIRNRLGYAGSDWLTRPITTIVSEHRRRWRLPPLRSPDDSFSKVLQISQLPRELDYPREHLPASFHYVGPLRRSRASEVPFPWERLDGRPLVYASLGTLQNRREPVFRCIAEACGGLPVQLVISHGGGLDERAARSLPGDPVVVGYAPQPKLLARAQLTITHAGLNTVLDSLAAGVPLVAVPITYEQPAIARRVEWAGVGLSVRLRQLTVQRLRAVVQEVMTEATYLHNAHRLMVAIQDAGGSARAADAVEAALSGELWGEQRTS